MTTKKTPRMLAGSLSDFRASEPFPLLRRALSIEDRAILNAAAEKAGQETSTWAREQLLGLAGKPARKPKK